MKTKIIESAQWISAYALDYLGKVLLGSGIIRACFLPLLLH